MAQVVKSVLVSKIYFDPANPRHDPIANENEILAHLLKHEDIRPLAKHIAEAGTTSPLELMALVPHPVAKTRFITAEGNRRLCALKLLADPDKAPNEREKKYFRTLQQSMPKPIRSINAAIFDTMEDTRIWVSLRHEGEQGGTGLKSWKAPQSTRFNLQGDGKNPNAQALFLIDHARRQRLLSEEDISLLSLTTLTRYLSNPVVRTGLGLANKSTIEITVLEDEFERALTQLLRDAIGPDAKVNSRTNAAQRKAYGESLLASGVAPITRGLEPYIPRAKAGSDKQGDQTPPTGSGDGATKKPRNKPNRDNDRYVVPSGFVARIDDPVFQRVFTELRTLNADNFTFAATYLFRAVIEQAAVLFLRKHGVGAPKELNAKLNKVREKLEAQHYQGRGLPALRKMGSDMDSKYSPDTIGLFIHGGAVPTKINAIRAWDTFEPIMIEMVRQLTS
jgi:hypothetical protein